jgi:tRNA-(ms[2]io[6]A)-hydroxylase
VLARGTASTDPELSRFYQRLGASERGHFNVFLRLANLVVSSGDVEARWSEYLADEAEILAAQPPGPFMHSGVAD